MQTRSDVRDAGVDSYCRLVHKVNDLQTALEFLVQGEASYDVRVSQDEQAMHTVSALLVHSACLY
jgi:hypothetical protein